MGAVGEDGVRVAECHVIRASTIKPQEFAAAEAREQAAVSARAARYRSYRPREPLTGRIAVVVDDGIATGSSARAACQIARVHGAARVVLAVPVAPPGWEARIGPDADELVCVETPADFYAIGESYADFSEITDDDVITCLDLAASEQAAAAGTPPATGMWQPS
jgi:putative phosphoribosyl transferase